MFLELDPNLRSQDISGSAASIVISFKSVSCTAFKCIEVQWVLFVNNLNGLRNLRQSKCVISVMSQSVWAEVCICTRFQQLNLSAPTVFPYSVCQTAACVVRLGGGKPSSSLRRQVIPVYHNVHIKWMEWMESTLDNVTEWMRGSWMIAAGTADAQSYTMWCSCACRPSAVMQESDAFAGLLQTLVVFKFAFCQHNISMFFTTVLLSSPVRCEHLVSSNRTPCGFVGGKKQLKLDSCSKTLNKFKETS